MKYVNLVDVCEFQGGSQPPKEEWELTPQNGFVRMLQIRDFTQKREEQIEYVKITNRLKLCEADDILIARYGASIGKILTGLKGAYNVAIVKTIPNEGLLYKRFLYYYLCSSQFQTFINNVGSRAAQAGFNKDDLKELQIPLPPLETQQKIADVLDMAQALIDKRKEQLEKMDELVQSVFYEMFGDPVMNEKEWKKESAKGYVDVLAGYAFSSKGYINDKTQIKLCGGLIIMSDRIDWDKTKYWPLDKTNGLSKYQLAANDIVLALDRPWISSGLKIGLVKPNDLPALLVQRTARLRSKNIEQMFLYYLLKDRAFSRHARPTETTVPHISTGDISTFPIIIPPIDLQKRFVALFEKIEQQKALMQQSLVEMENNFHSIMQRAFKGELF